MRTGSSPPWGATRRTRPGDDPNANHVYKSETRAPSEMSQSEIVAGYADENHALADGLVDAIVEFVTTTNH